VGQQSPDPASFSLVDALQDDPFYLAISVDYEKEPRIRRLRLAEYFSYSLDESRIFGRCVQLEDRRVGAAAWLLPGDEVRQRASRRKLAFLERELGPVGQRNYKAIVSWMAERSAPLVSNAWYLPIIGLAPHAQGQGLGGHLLRPTLAEADREGVDCYLETFSARSVRFYERFGFRSVGSFSNPLQTRNIP